MRMHVCHVYMFTALYLTLLFLPPASHAFDTFGHGRREQENYDECVLFKANDSYSMRVSESYLELGLQDIPATEGFDISFEVFPDATNYNGPLFSIGSDNFQYYEWKTKAINTQFLVIEFVYGALAMLVKALDEPHLYQMEIFKTYPTPYDIDDGIWHFVQVTKEDRGEGIPHMWHLTIDDISISNELFSRTNIDIFDRPAYLGGRPGYRSSQFRGIIKNLRINGENRPLRGRASFGLTEVWHCSAPEVQKFLEELEGAVPYDEEEEEVEESTNIGDDREGKRRRISIGRRRPRPDGQT